MNDSTVDHLLQQVYAIVQKHEEIAEIRGDNFNIFSVLRLESDEVTLHSRFIGELLNPKGNHGQGSKFLKLFVQVTGLKEYSDEQLDTARVDIEENRGNISEDNKRGGRIDLVIKPMAPSKVIVIENKINAGDQHKQLERYKSEYPHSNLFYLTLDGKEPTAESKGEGFYEFVCISYKDQITNWLELCLRETLMYPLLRETITQYIYLVKKLTGNAMDQKMKKDLIRTIINRPENIEAAFKIHYSIEDVKLEIIKGLKGKIHKSVKENFGLETEFDDNFGKANSEFSLLKKDWAYKITLGFAKDYDKPWIGVENKEENSSQTQEDKDLIPKAVAGISYLRNLDDGNPKWIWCSWIKELNDIPWSEMESEYLKVVIKTVGDILSKIKHIIEKPIIN